MVPVSPDLLREVLDTVNGFGALSSGGVERLAWSEPEVAARRWLLQRCVDLGLDASMDEAGNVWAFAGRRPAVMMGSHLDTVPDGGRFDGALGIAAALAGLSAARDREARGWDRLGLLCFTDEEGVRFGLGMTGSRAVAGLLDEREVAAAADRDGVRLSDAMAAAGARPGELGAVAARRRDLAAYLELHVEQGRRLDRREQPVAVVEAIAGIDHHRVEVRGEANHAGTTLPEDRHDAFLVVAEAALAAERVMRSEEGVAATVGTAGVIGGAQNVVPGLARMSLDVRAGTEERIRSAVGAVVGELEAAAGRRGCEVDVVRTKGLAPAPMDPGCIAALRSAAGAVGLDPPVLASMAGHDAMNLVAAGVPCGMAFVRSLGGISHSPRESSRLEDCALGATVLLGAALELACGLPG